VVLPPEQRWVFARSIANWIAAGGRLFPVLYFDLLLSKSFCLDIFTGKPFGMTFLIAGRGPKPS
jgi:hypothetical protein